MELLHKFANTSWLDRWLLLRAFIVVVAIRVALLVVPFRFVRRFLDRTSAGYGTSTRDIEYVDRVVWAVRASARRFLGDKPCLVQALAASWFLRRKGFETTLRLGVVKDRNDQFIAHAWLDCGEITVIGGKSSPGKYIQLKPLADSSQS